MSNAAAPRSHADYHAHVSLVLLHCFSSGADFVHLFDLCASTPTVQTIDVFGEITGAMLSPDDSTLFIGVTDAVYGQSLSQRCARGETAIN